MESHQTIDRARLDAFLGSAMVNFGAAISAPLALATEADLRREVIAKGLTRFRRAAETPFNRLFGARR